MANAKTASLVTITDLTDAPIGILSNESFILAADLNGVVGSFSGASTTLSIKLGGADDSANWSVSAGTPVGITGSLVGKTYTVTAMGSDIGYVDLTASRTGFSNIVKRFSVAKAKQGAKGATGATGATGAQGKGISSTSVTYQAGSSGTSYPTGSWLGTIPSVADNQFLWTKVVINYTSGDPTTSYSVGKMGAQGPQGNTGATGAAGVGISSTSVTYQAGSSGTTEPTGTWAPTVPTVADNQYLWTKVVISYTSGNPTTSYSVGKMGAQGPQGAKGDTGAKGATGDQGPKGDMGVSVTGVLEKYLATSASSGVTTATSGWTDAIQTMTVTNKYLWNYEIISFSDGSSSPTLPVIIGVYGNTGNTGATGATGRSLVSIKEYYLATAAATGVTRATGGWTEAIQTTTPTNKYLWNYEELTWSVAPLKTYIEPIIIGIHGDKGDKGDKGDTGATGAQGKGISSTVVTYQAGSSGTTAPTGAWGSTVPAVADNQFLWTKTVITYTDSNTTTAYSVGKMGAQGPQGNTGSTGAAGVGISSTSVTYQAGSSGTTAPTGTWSATVPTVADNQFLWTKVVINYTSGNPTTSYSVGKMGAQGPQGAKGDTGAKGATGSQGPKGDTGVSITGVSEWYLATASSSGVTTATGGWTEAIQTITATNKYLWNYEIISFSDGSSSPTLPVIIGVYGNTGNTGATGRALTGVTEYYFASSSASGITRPATDGTGGWTTTMQVTTPTNKYLWNYEKLTWSVAPLTTYIEPIIIGIHGDKGDKGDTGAQGSQGIQGPPGTNGQSLYTWVKYADNASGGGMADSPTGKKYIGLAYNKTTATESSTVGDYTWSLIQGPQGIQGPGGSNGQSLYTWIKYADTPTTGMNDSPTGKKYLGIAYNKTTSTESSTYADYSWSLIEGPQGPQGTNGTQGPQGIQGIPAEQYHVVPSVNTIIRKLLSPYISPTSMTFKVYKITGNGLPALVTSGVTNTIAYSTDGISFTNVHSSIQPTSSGTTTLTLNNATYNFARGSSVSGYKNAVCVRCISTIGGVEIGRITVGFSLDDALLEIAKIDGSVVKIDGSKIYAKSIVANEAIFGGSITANELGANAVTATKIAANAIEVGHISSGAASSLDLSSNNSVKIAVDGIQVGGRNLYVNTIGYTPNTPFVNSWTTGDAFRTVFDDKIIHCKQPFKAGDIVTIQAESDAIWSQTHGPSAATDGKLGMWFYLCATPDSSVYTSAVFLSNGLGPDKTKFVATRVLPVVSGLSEFYISMRLNGYSYPDGTAHTANLWNVKLERGNKATDWTPAPEDVDAKINGVSQDVSGANEAIDQIIYANVTKQFELDTQISNLNLALESLNTGVGENNTSTQGAIDSIQAMVDALEAQRSVLSDKVTLLEDAKLNTDNYIQIGTVKLLTGREVFGVAVGKDVDILNPDGTINTFERSMTAITSNEFMILTGGEVVGVFDSTGMTSESVKVNKIVMGKRFEWSMTSSNAMVLKKGG